MNQQVFDGIKGMIDGNYVDLSNYDPEQDKYIFSSFRKGLNFEFEFPLTTHCNLNCQMCTVFSPIAEKEFLEVESFYKDVNRIAELFGKENNWLRLVGGEPLLHPKINEIMLLARKAMPNSLISITTNGMLANRMSREFYDMVRKARIVILHSPYPPLDSEKIINFFRNENVPAFKTVKKFTSRQFKLDLQGKQDALSAFKRCSYRCNFVLDGKMARCFYPQTIRHFNKFFNQNLEVTENDIIDIHANGRETIEQFLNNQIPFCRYCINDSPSYHEWQPSCRKIEEWA